MDADTQKNEMETSKLTPVNAWWAFDQAVHLLGSFSDTSIHQKRQALTQFRDGYYNDIRSSLENLNNTPLRGIREDFQGSFDLFMANKHDVSKREFASVRHRVEGIISSSKDIQLQIEAARIAIVCTLFENFANVTDAEMVVISLMKMLHKQDSIRQMVAICIGTSIINRIMAKFMRDKKLLPMRRLCIMNFILADYFLGQGLIEDLNGWPGVSVSSKRIHHPLISTLSMTEVKQGRLVSGTGEEQGDKSRIHLLASESCIITFGKRRYGIEAWCPETLQQVATFVDGFRQSTSLATCHGDVLYVAKSGSQSPGTNLTISAFNTLTRKPINVFFMVQGECVHLLCRDSAVHGIIVITDDGVVHQTGTSSFDHVSRVMSFDMESLLSSENSAATPTRLIYSSDGSIKAYDMAKGKHMQDVQTPCWQYPLAVGNYLCTFEMTVGGVIIGAEVRRIDDMNLVFGFRVNEPSSVETPIMSCDISDNLMLLLIERMVTVWDLVSGTQLTAIVFDIPGQFKGYRPCSACFYKRKYIYVATLGGSLFRFAISD